MTEEMPRTDELQPLTEVQVQKWREYSDRLWNTRIKRWDIIPEGWENTWELRVTPELVILYADGVEDYNPWYEAFRMYGTGPIGVGESPFGPAIAPPLLLSENTSGTHETTEFRGRVHGAIASSHDTQILAPCPLGTVVRYHSKVTKKFIKRGRQYMQCEVTAEDAATGKLLMKEIKETLCQYRKVSE